MNIQRILDTLWRRRGPMDPESSEQDCAGDTSRAGEGARSSSRPASKRSAAPEPPSVAGGAPTDLCKRPAAPLLVGRPDTSLARMKEPGEEMTMDDRLLRRRQVEEITSISRSSIYRLMQMWRVPTARQGRARRRQVEGKRHHGLGGVAAGSEELGWPARHGLDASCTTGATAISC